MKRAIQSVLAAAGDLVFPAVCPSCRMHPASERGFLCEACRIELLNQIAT
ncbi:MAG: hypothetical protein HN909_01685, partial [Phycisphaerales bacterium]|nr:hypothetical protein [Phycisphaerales bacterium]